MHVSVIGNPGDAVVVTVRGDLDLDSATVLGTTLDRVLDQPAPRVVVDVSGIAFCDSTGLGSFVLGHHRARAAGGWLRVAAPSAWLLALLETVGLTPQVEIYPTVADALATDRDL
ncbi:STAS domain-containing protein [Amorphoplanes digitatis]|uniref:Anti-sigma factor antagonist n=1 Tax=Actinoplanes digitatis TaxID=1868 RepID=A0A7W7MPX9_9ACTN|nr:STAS domain-containing protein [Actinoplanes digitatis]MBB4762563.1 anti-anti-sigma factor [Actinoplanes digitatis]BFE71422.1 STAS domain-containing protein [Actinoplanes digitatis]GID91938.1 anti-sigma factor antagonist [Actinoplanes digitatis]